MKKNKRIVITGMGLVSCFGNDVDQFYEALLAGRSGVAPITRFPCADAPTQFAACVPDFDTSAYIDGKQARRIDPVIKYSLVAGKKALELAGLGKESLDSLNKYRCGILIGSGMGGMGVFYDGVKTLINEGRRRVTPFFVPYVISNMGGALLAIETGFNGPNYSISTACATANYSIHSAAQHIRNGSADLMVCGGSEAAINPIGLTGFNACRALSERNDDPTKASRPWDKNRDGFVMGEGAGVLVLESLEHALARGAPIFAEYLGGAHNCDAYHMTNPREDGSMGAMCMEDAIIDAGIPKENINYINAHATSTPIGDMCEVKGIVKVFGKQVDRIKMNAPKSMIGHPLGAAGGLEAIISIKAINTSMLHPTINLEDCEDLHGIDPVANVAQKHVVQAAISNSFGFGGHNSSIILSRYEA